MWCIDTLRREEDVLREMKKAHERQGQHDIAASCRSLLRELFGVRQLLEVERATLERLRPGVRYAGPDRRT